MAVVCDLCGGGGLEGYLVYSDDIFDLSVRLLSPGDGVNCEGLLKQHLLLYFVAKKLLKLEDGQCLELLQCLEGNRSGGDFGGDQDCCWDKMCQRCWEILVEGADLFKKMVELQGKLDLMGKRLRKQLKGCSGSDKSRIAKKLQTFTASDELDVNQVLAVVPVKFEMEENIEEAFAASFPENEFQPKVEDDEYVDYKACYYTGEIFQSVQSVSEPDPNPGPSGSHDNSITPNLHNIERKSTKKAFSPTIRSNKARSTFGCNLCKMVYKTANGLKGHLKTHEESTRVHQNKYDCPKCNYPTVSEWKLRYHLTVAHEETCKNKCSICGYVASRRWIYDKHMKEKHNVQVWTPIDQKEAAVKHDNQPLVSEKSLHRRRKQVRSQPREKKQNIKKEGLSKKKRTKGENKCSLCNKSFGRPHLLKEHLSLHRRFDKYQDSVTGMYVCSLCTKSFKSVLGLILHKKMHPESGTLVDPQVNPEDCPLCPHCGRFFSTKLQLHRHIKINHEGFFRYSCDVCGKGIQNKVKLGLHKLTHEKNRVKTFVCEICGSAYSHKFTLIKHVSTYHPEGTNNSSEEQCPASSKKTYKCKFCDANFPFKHLSERHLSDAHQDRYTFKCDVGECDKAYISASSLRLHKEIVHSESNQESPSCQYCGKKFVHRHYMISHYKWCAEKRKQGDM